MVFSGFLIPTPIDRYHSKESPPILRQLLATHLLTVIVISSYADSLFLFFKTFYNYWHLIGCSTSRANLTKSIRSNYGYSVMSLKLNSITS